jgi:hypothetical protein
MQSSVSFYPDKSVKHSHPISQARIRVRQAIEALLGQRSAPQLPPTSECVDQAGNQEQM